MGGPGGYLSVGTDLAVASTEGLVSASRDDLEPLCRDLYPKLVRLVSLHGYSRAQSEDIAQDALTKAVERWRRVSRMENPSGWIVRVALNAAASWGRRRQLEARTQERLGRDASGTVDQDPAQHTADRLAVVAALAQLPKRQREVVLLRFFLDLDVTGTAGVLGCAEGTVRAHTSRAIEHLRASGLAPAEEQRE